MLIRGFSALFTVECRLEVVDFSAEKKKGQFAVEQKKKKREIIEEGKRRVDVPADVGDEEKKALEQTGEDATAGW